jgi:undecaprenyl-diphosphatase
VIGVDVYAVEWLNQFARRIPTLDVLIVYLIGSYLFKGGVMMAFVWWGWFRRAVNPELDRLRLTAVLAASLVALVAARTLAWTLPNRLRPMHDAAVDMQLPIGMPPGALTGWSSFPSDHATLFGCLATGMFLVSRRAGLVASLYVVVIILLPRVYSGLHYPSDLLAGYALGACLAWLLSREAVLGPVVSPVYRWLTARPGLSYPLLFLVSYQFATLFDESRSFGQLLYVIMVRLLQGDQSILQMGT